jgi:sulfur relay protein TusB/DsrH
VKVLILLTADSSAFSEVVDGLKKQGNEIGLLLIQDGVFQADKGNPASKGIQKLGAPVHVSRAHATERGIISRLMPGVILVGYPEMVDLIMDRYDRVVSL